MDHIQTQLDDEQKTEDKIQELNQKIAVSLWIQFIGQFAEAIYLSQLEKLQPDSSGELKNLVGQWVMTVGQALEAIGQTTQSLTIEVKQQVEAQIQGIQGDALQALGSALQVVGSKEMLIDYLKENIDGDIS